MRTGNADLVVVRAGSVFGGKAWVKGRDYKENSEKYFHTCVIDDDKYPVISVGYNRCLFINYSLMRYEFCCEESGSMAIFVVHSKHACSWLCITL